MKEGLRPGLQEVLYVQVTPEMTVEFGGRALHPFYSTYAACHHAEHVCRLVLEPFLKEHEDGIGSGLTIQHHAPALVGQTVKLTAVATRVREHHLACDFEITESGRRIASGNVHQVVLSKSRIADIHAAAKSSSVSS